MTITRRSFLAGLGSVTVGLLFHKKLDRVLESLERELVDEPQTLDQLPAAAEIVVVPQTMFRPERLVVAPGIAPLFVIEDIRIGSQSQFTTNAAVPAEIFSAMPIVLSTATPATEIRFRVRYVGKDPQGARFQAALIGSKFDGSPGKHLLPIDSHRAIAA